MRQCTYFIAAAMGLLLLVTARGAEAAHQSTNTFLEVVQANFPAWDTNHDQILSTEELDMAFEDPANKGPAAAALAALRHASLATNAPALTLANISKLATNENSNLLKFYNQSLGRIKRVTHRELFVSGLPQLSTIHQGRMGNCFCLAPLGAMVYRDPHEVASWFEVQSNGNVLVKMAEGPISVPPPTDAELAFASGNTQDGVWVNLYEKAIGEARNERKPPGKRFEVALDAVAKGGNEVPIMSYITGHKVSVMGLRWANTTDVSAAKMTQLREKLAYASSNRLIMVGATLKPSTPNLSPHHAYALLDYDAASDAVKLWNPHGNNFKPKGPAGLTNGYPTTNGILTMPLADLVNQFHHVAIEQPETTPLKWPDQWELMAEAGHFDEAASDLKAIIESDDTEDWKLYLLTPLLIECGRLTEYTNHCKAMLNQYEKTDNPSIAERTAKSCLLLPAVMSPDDLARATNLAARAVELSQKGNWTHWRLMTRGLAEYRSGRYNDAIKSEALAQKALANPPDDRRDLNGPACEADTYSITAMAQEKLNEKHLADSNLKQALKIVQTELPKLNGGDLGQGWFDVLMANIILREATEP